MAKVEFKFSVDATMYATVEASSLEECREQLRQMTFDELLENGFIKGFDIYNIDEKVLEKDVTYKVTNIDYDIDEDSLEDTEDKTVEEIKKSLPKEFEFTLSVDANTKEKLDIEDRIFEETGYWVNDFDYKEIKEDK